MSEMTLDQNDTCSKAQDFGYMTGATSMYHTTRKTAGNRRTAESCLPSRQQRSVINEADVIAAAFDLTPAEIRTLGRLLGGSSPAEIADELGVALPTVRTHLSNIFAKTGTARQLDLVLLATEFTKPDLRSQEGG